MKRVDTKKINRIFFTIGLVIICILLVPWMILGENGVVTYHDQLDGEMIAYILQAKHLFDGDILPEFMNGAAKTALTPPAPASVLLFVGGNYEGALFIMQLLGSLVGYLGMFLLVKEVTGRSFAAMVAGGLYGALPFLPVYGFSQYGVPMLLWCVLQLKQGRRTWLCMVYGLVFALNSSLALVGFAVLAVLGLWFVAEAAGNRVACKKADQQSGKLQNRGKRSCLWRLWVLWLVLFTGYLMTNLPLIKQILGVGEVMTSHKTEYVLAAEGFVSGWISGLLYGGQHSQDYHLSLLVAGLAVVIISVIVKVQTDEAKRIRRGVLWAVACNVLLAGVAAFWNCGVGVMLRENLGALGAFQVDRFLWLSPCLWYLCGGCCVALAIEMANPSDRADTYGKDEQPADALQRRWKAGAGVCGLLLLIGLSISALQIVKNSDFKSNIQKLRNPEYAAMSYGDYYAIGVYDQVVDFMAEYTGLKQPEYRVVSLGIDPAAALYHGFYCLDGYSNNYALEYKHAFREVIAPALQESEYLRDYYDDWGNRCYVFGSECPGYYTIEKNGFYFSHLELDAKALKNMGGSYLFSAAYIANAEELGLALLRKEPFETDESYYRIYVYEVR